MADGAVVVRSGDTMILDWNGVGEGTINGLPGVKCFHKRQFGDLEIPITR